MLLTPDPPASSTACRTTVTSPLFQPAAFAAGVGVAVVVGGVVSGGFTTTGLVTTAKLCTDGSASLTTSTLSVSDVPSATEPGGMSVTDTFCVPFVASGKLDGENAEM